MNKDTVKGSMDDTMGRAKRQVGEWTGNTSTQAEGVAQQIKGKAEKVVGNMKDAARDARTDADREHANKVEANREAANRDYAATRDNRR